MKKLTVAAGVLLVLFSLAINVYFLWPTSEKVDGPPVTEDKKTDSIQHFLPTGWSIASSKVEVLESIYLPFLHRKFVKKHVRVAQFEGSGVSFLAPKTAYTNSRLTRGTIVTLADTGQLLRLELHGSVPTGPFPGQMTLAKAEDYYQSVGAKYVSIPMGLPELPLQNVLNRIYQHGSAGIEKAARIEVAYIMQTSETRPGAAPTTNWIVNLYGIPPYPAVGISKEPDEARSFWRYTLDASGDVLSRDTLP